MRHENDFASEQTTLNNVLKTQDKYFIVESRNQPLEMVIAALREMFISGRRCVCSVSGALSRPSRGRCPWSGHGGRRGCLLDCGGWGLNRAALCVPAEVGSVCQAENTPASVLLTARLAYPSCTCLPSDAAQTVCE